MRGGKKELHQQQYMPLKYVVRWGRCIMDIVKSIFRNTK